MLTGQGDDGRLVVYTCAFGPDIALNPPPESSGEVDYLCFTDRERESAGWPLRIVEPVLAMDLPRSSRLPKILAHRYLPDHQRSLYVDTGIRLLDDPRALWDALIPGDQTFGALRHSYRDVLLDEFVAVAEHGFDAHPVLSEQVEHYAIADPEALSRPVVWGAVIARRHHREACVEAMTWWLAQVLRYSRRDQLSLPTALARLGDEAVNLVELDNFASPFHEWPVGGFRKDERYLSPASRRLLSSVLRVPAAEAAADAALARAQELTAELEAQRVALAEQVARAEAAEHSRDLALEVIAGLRQDIEDLRSSTSWRVTAGLRAVTGRLARRTAP